MIVCENISKSFEEVKAVNQLSFEVKKGELFGLIGADGAGKTTLIRMLTSLLLPDEGHITFEGKDIVSDYKYVRQHIGYSPGKFSLYQDLSIEENLEFFTGVFGMTLDESYHLIEPVYKMLEPFKNRKAGDLSGGMKQKLSLCCALVHVPKLLVLDEPTTGVDAVSRKEFWELLKGLKEDGMTIIVSTPYMDEARMCDRVVLLQNGQNLVTDTPSNIEKSYPYPIQAVYTKEIPQVLAYLRTLDCTHSAYSFGACIHWSLKEKLTEIQANQSFEALQKLDASIALSPIEASIEDCFMHLMTDQYEDH